ncbi:hypothetical protein BJ138DRAFT_980094, partial [Hygrophoropsis aurantiaca]
EFPPKPPTPNHHQKIIRQFCNETSPTRLAEAGCAVCGSLNRLELMKPLDVLDQS